MSNIDGIPVTLQAGETSPTAQEGLVLAGIDAAGLGQLSKVAASGAIVTGAPFSGRELWADLHEAATAGAPDYFLLIDLDSPTAPHTSGTKARICSGEAHIIKSAVAASWTADIGVVTRIDGTDADVAWLGFLSLHAEDTAVAVGSARFRSLADCLELDVVGGDLAKVWTGHLDTNIAAINTAAGTVPDVKGVARTAAVGDVVARAVKNVGMGTAELSITISYYVDP